MIQEESSVELIDNIELIHKWPRTRAVHHSYTLIVTLAVGVSLDDLMHQVVVVCAGMNDTSSPTNHQVNVYWMRERERREMKRDEEEKR